jgi:hypothetical protein
VSETDTEPSDRLTRCNPRREHVVDVLQSAEEELGDDSRAYFRASQLDTSRDLTAYSVGTILSLLASEPEAVAEKYDLPEACRLEVAKWGNNGGSARWEVRWHA